MVGMSLMSRDAVLAALAECDALGRETFLKRYGYGYSRRYPLIHNGRVYDSKAIVGVAYGKQHGTPLRAESFSGGLTTVVPTLRRLGFAIDMATPLISRIDVGVTYDRRRVFDAIDSKYQGARISSGDLPLALVCSKRGVETSHPSVAGAACGLCRCGGQGSLRKVVLADRNAGIARSVNSRRDILLFEDFGDRGVRFAGLFECVSARMLGGRGKLEAIRKLVVLDLVRKDSSLASC